jgi:membrane-associated phospholipid phosphatase
MLSALETGAALELVLALQSQRSDLLNALALLLHNLGANIAFLALLTLIFWSLNRRLGTELLLALLVSGTATGLLKLLFQTPRPFQVSDLVVPLVTEDSFGIPSGHVLINVFVWGYAALFLRRRWIYLVFGVYILLMAWSRIYTGVHFPQDLIAGLVFGLLGLWLFMRYRPRLSLAWSNSKTWTRIGLSLMSAVLILFFPYYDDTRYALAGLLIGVVLAFELESRYVNFDNAGPPAQRILRYLLGIAFVFAIFYGLRSLASDSSAWLDVWRALRYALTALAAILVWPWLGQRLGLFNRPSQPDLS